MNVRAGQYVVTFCGEGGMPLPSAIVPQCSFAEVCLTVLDKLPAAESLCAAREFADRVMAERETFPRFRRPLIQSYYIDARVYNSLDRPERF